MVEHDYEAMRSNRDLWLRRYTALEKVVESLRREIARFEESVEPGDDEWSFLVSADAMVGLGLARVLCDIPFEPGFDRVIEGAQ